MVEQILVMSVAQGVVYCEIGQYQWYHDYAQTGEKKTSLTSYHLILTLGIVIPIAYHKTQPAKDCIYVWSWTYH